MQRIASVIIIACAALLRPWAVCAQGAEPELANVSATIVRIEGDEVFLDVGSEALEGARKLTVYRRVVVRHPVTRKSLVDHFAIGELSIVQARDALTLARAAGTPARPFAVGDGVEIQVGGPSHPPAVAQAPPALAASAGAHVESAEGEPARAERANAPMASATTTVNIGAADAETRELLRTFQSTLARPPEVRAGRYEAFLQSYPQSPHRAFLEQEIRYMRAWDRASAKDTRDTEAAERAARLASAVEFLPPEMLPADKPAALALLVQPQAQLRGLVLFVRGAGAQSGDYRSLPMQLDGRGHAQVRVPAELVRPPGLEFFIEAVNTVGERGSAFGSAAQPRPISVPSAPVPAEQRKQPLMRVRMSSELASFDGTSGRDYFLINEGDFTYRLRLQYLYSIRMGYGRFSGEGGTVDELDQRKLPPRAAGFTYAFLESEFEISELVGLALRGTIGLGRPDPGASGEISGGIQTRLRLGRATGTHLVIAGELMPEIGQRASLYLGWELIERVPMAAEVQVTDQPVNSDELAVRIVYEVGYRFSDRIALALRPSYQLRTIRHAGPGVGLSATFDW